jgi:hypothetical protein
MAEEKQTYANHVRYDPSFHFLLFPVAAITFIVIVRKAVAGPSALSIWMAFASLVFLYGVLLMRAYSLKVQDRIIRLEERLRLMELLPPEKHVRIPELTRKQLVALRFASDAELPALAERSWNEKLEPKQIKQAIKDWRGDYFRI